MRQLSAVCSAIAAFGIMTASMLAQARGPAAAVVLAVGDPAPAFALPGSDGRVHTLAEHRGKEAVVLAWFARAFSAG